MRKALARTITDPAALAARLLISYQAAERLIAEAAPVDAEPGETTAFVPARPRRGGGRCQAIAKLRDGTAERPDSGQRTVPPRALRGAGWTPATCQWIEGEPRERNFCGKPAKAGSSYCEEHHKRCWRPATAHEEKLLKGAG